MNLTQVSGCQKSLMADGCSAPCEKRVAGSWSRSQHGQASRAPNPAVGTVPGLVQVRQGPAGRCHQPLPVSLSFPHPRGGGTCARGRPGFILICTSLGSQNPVNWDQNCPSHHRPSVPPVPKPQPVASPASGEEEEEGAETFLPPRPSLAPCPPSPLPDGLCGSLSGIQNTSNGLFPLFSSSLPARLSAFQP